jgi:hypothetical protein
MFSSFNENLDGKRYAATQFDYISKEFLQQLSPPESYS